MNSELKRACHCERSEAICLCVGLLRSFTPRNNDKQKI